MYHQFIAVIGLRSVYMMGRNNGLFAWLFSLSRMIRSTVIGV